MTTTLFHRYTAAIRNFNGDASSPDLLLASEGPVAAYYAPFDYLNPNARLMLVGLTPGRTQAVNALREAQLTLERGGSAELAHQQSKQTGAFSGDLRPNLTAMLDHIGLAKWLELSSCTALFGEAGHLVQTTSVLPFPVFVSGKNYNGSPNLLKSPLLRAMMVDHFVPTAKALPKAVFLPLGKDANMAMAWLVSQGHVAASQVLSGLPHPSGQNGERIAYFLGQKETGLSRKTDPLKLDGARAALRTAVAALA